MGPDSRTASASPRKLSTPKHSCREGEWRSPSTTHTDASVWLARFCPARAQIPTASSICPTCWKTTKRGASQAGRRNTRWTNSASSLVPTGGTREEAELVQRVFLLPACEAPRLVVFQQV